MRHATRHLIPLLLLMLALFPLSARAADASQFFDHSLGNFKEELADAIKAGKQGVLVMFEAEDCPYCRRMKAQVLNREDVQAYYRKRFSIFSVDVLGSVTVTDFSGTTSTEKNFAISRKVRGTPTFVFIGADGKEIARYTGATRDATEFMELGRYVAEGHWRSKGFAEFYSGSRR